ncbi:MAG: dihydropteroate synthase [Planctomycetia bacterium]
MRRITIMGVINVTPDSFSDGGLFLDPARAVEHAHALIADGAEWLDVGGESSRPGALSVSAAEERGRILPVIRALSRAVRVPISIDTTKSEVASAALDEGASLVNDIEAGVHDPQMLPLVARRGAQYCAMHMQGRPRDMQIEPRYHNVLGEVAAFLDERREAAIHAGIEPSRILLDPGIGFGKTLEHNLALLRGLPHLLELGAPLLVGVSRKSFLAKLVESSGRVAPPAQDRAALTLAAELHAARQGAAVIRTHDVRALREAWLVESALSAGAG